MSNLRTCFVILVVGIGFTTTVCAQTVGDYRTKASGNWSDPVIWEQFDGLTWISALYPPNKPPLVSIVSGHTVIIDNTEIILNNLTVEIGAILTDLSTLSVITITLVGELKVYGTYNITSTDDGSFTNMIKLTIYSTGSFTCRKMLYDIANNYGTARIANQFLDMSNPTTPWVNQANSTLFIGDTAPLSGISASAQGNTVNYYSSSGGQSIIPPIDSYYNLTLSGGAANKRLTQNISVLGNLSITGSASFRLINVAGTAAFNVSVAGDWNNSSSNGAAFVSSNPSGTVIGTVTLNGSSTQRIINTGHASGTRFNRLAIANTSTSVPQINVLADVTVGNTLTMTSMPVLGNLINLNGKKFQLGTSNASVATLNHSGSSTSGWFYNGNFSRYFVTNASIPTGTNDGFFPVGTSTNFRPFYLSSSTVLTSTPVATLTCPPSTSTYSKENIPDTAGEILKLALSGWRIQLTNGTGGDFSVNAGGTGIGIIGDVNDLRLSQLSAAAGLPGVNTGTSPSPMVQRTGLTATDMTDITFYVGSVNLASSPLPIQLVSFTGQAEGSTVNLQWVTQSEKNCDYYTLHRSANGIDFVQIGTRKGSGTTNASSLYELQDTTPFNGTNYYRLEQTDFDGKKSTQAIISVEASGVVPFAIYPNPVQSGRSIHIDINGKAAFSKVAMSFYDVAGRQIHNSLVTINEVGSFQGDIELPQVSPGLYFIKIGTSIMKFSVN